MALILAIDTTGDVGSLALVDGERVIEEATIESADGFAHVLFQEIDALLKRNSVAMNQIAAFASAAGPGSFTGVRVGLTAVKGLAAANGRKAIAISNLQALASLGTRALRATVIDARRGEIYGAVYDAQLRLVGEEIVQPFDQWMAALPAGDLEFVSAGFRVEDALRRPVTEAPRALAGAIGKIAARRFAAGLGQEPEEIDANYVRRSDAELLWRDK